MTQPQGQNDMFKSIMEAMRAQQAEFTKLLSAQNERIETLFRMLALSGQQEP